MSISSTAASHNAAQAMKPLAVPVKTARGLLGIGNTKMWELIKDHRVDTIRIGRKRLVVYDSLEKLVKHSKAD
jgi:hypothetical protein